MGHSDQIDHDQKILANDQRPEKMGSWLKWGMLGWHVAVKPSVLRHTPSSSAAGCTKAIEFIRQIGISNGGESKVAVKPCIGISKACGKSSFRTSSSSRANSNRHLQNQNHHNRRFVARICLDQSGMIFCIDP